MAAFVPDLARLALECEPEGLTLKNSGRIAAEVAKIFAVHPEDVGILRVENDCLVFAHPHKLHNVGRIPLNSSSAAAVRTVTSKHPEIMNNFIRTRHATFFEMVDVRDPAMESKSTESNPAVADKNKAKKKEEQIIQKMMSAPVIGEGKVAGVIQVCHKGSSAAASGPDFTPADLQKLTVIASTVARCFK